MLHRGDDCALDMLDGDPDLEDGGDTESNGDEADFSGYAEELLTCHWSGDGMAQAHPMIRASPAASQHAGEFAGMPNPPVIYDFRGMRRR